MEFLILADKFKGSLDSAEVVRAIEAGLRSTLPDAGIRSVIASDGGEGLLDALLSTDPSWCEHTSQTQDAAGRPLASRFLVDPRRSVAVLELAQTAGLASLPLALRDPQLTSTLGTGQQLRQALDLGVGKVFMGLGGSATNDGGMGLATALGYRFLDAAGEPLAPCGAALERIASIDASQIDPRLSEVEIVALNDVTNPLFGPQGAAAVYAPQKGADAAAVARLDAGLRQLARCASRLRPDCDPQQPGAGAAGGTGFGLMQFLNASFQPGAPFILCRAGVFKTLSAGTTDWLITGEGQIDSQSLQGKWVDHVARLGSRYHVPVVAFCGQCRLTAEQRLACGLTEIRPLHDPQTGSWKASLDNAGPLLTKEVQRWALSLPQPPA